MANGWKRRGYYIRKKGTTRSRMMYNKVRGIKTKPGRLRTDIRKYDEYRKYLAKRMRSENKHKISNGYLLLSMLSRINMDVHWRDIASRDPTLNGLTRTGRRVYITTEGYITQMQAANRKLSEYKLKLHNKVRKRLFKIKSPK